MEKSVLPNSPYYNGYIVDYGNEILTLERPEDPTIYFNRDNGGSYYVTKMGDMLDRLAFEKYGDDKLWHIIYASNVPVLDNPIEPLPPGITLYIPNENQFLP